MSTKEFKHNWINIAFTWRENVISFESLQKDLDLKAAWTQAFLIENKVYCMSSIRKVAGLNPGSSPAAHRSVPEQDTEPQMIGSWWAVGTLYEQPKPSVCEWVCVNGSSIVKRFEQPVDWKSAVEIQVHSPFLCKLE